MEPKLNIQKTKRFLADFICPKNMKILDKFEYEKRD
jgi:hypothetical protein